MENKGPEHPDQRYIDGLRRGDSAVIEEIYQQHAQRITQWVLRNSGDESDARDLFQESLLAIYQKAQQGLRLTCPFSAFFFITCRNQWINTLRQRKNREVTINDEQLSITESAQEAVQLAESQEQQRQLFLEKFRELGPACQEILGLSWTWDEERDRWNSLQDVATQLDRSYGYIRKKVAECRARLMELIHGDSRFGDL